MRRNIRLYFRLLRVNLLANMEYKGWWLMLVQAAAVALADLAAPTLLFGRFGAVGEWTQGRILLVYGLAVTGYGLAQTFCRGFDTFPFRMIRSGGFDRLLLRPGSLAVQVAGNRFDLHRICRALVGAALVASALVSLGVPLTLWRAAMLLFAVVGSFVMYCGVFVLTSGIAFFSIQSTEWIFILTTASYPVTRCPVPYLPQVLRHAFTFLLPMLVVSYYPASAACGWGEPLWTGWLALPAGLLFLCASTAFWRVGVRHYAGTGS